MNLFVSDPNPQKCAEWLDDKRVRHMPKETLEMLIMSVHKKYKYAVAPFILWGGDSRKARFAELYYNPVTEWVARSRQNTWWTYNHLFALFEEYRFRFGVNHYLYSIAISVSHYFKPSLGVPKTFCNASGQVGSNIFDLYKKCLIQKWTITDEIKPVVFSRRGPPSWFVNSSVEQLDLFRTEKSMYGSGYYDPAEFDDLPF